MFKRYMLVITCICNLCFRQKGIAHPMLQILSVMWLGDLPRQGRITVEQERQPSADMSVVQRQS